MRLPTQMSSSPPRSCFSQSDWPPLGRVRQPTLGLTLEQAHSLPPCGRHRILRGSLCPQHSLSPSKTSVPKKSIGLHKKSKTLPKKSKSCRKFQSVPTAFSSSTNVHSEWSYPFGCTTERPPPPKNYFLSEPPNRGSGWACQKI